MVQGDGGGDGGRLALLRALDGWRRGFGAAPVVCQWGIAGPAGIGGSPGMGEAAAFVTPGMPGAVTTDMPGASVAATPGMPGAAASVTTGITGVAASVAAAAGVGVAGGDGGYVRDVGGGLAGGAALTVTVSTGDVDRHGDVVSPEGWRLDSYRRNPVVLWAHDYRHPAIGRAPAVWQEGPALLARIEFAPTQFAGQVAALYRDGYQRGVSVGFRPLRFEERRDARSGAFLGIRFLEQELLEISAVPVPANRAALLRGWDGVGVGNGAGVDNNSNGGRVMPGYGDEARRLGDTPASAVVALLRGWDGVGVGVGAGIGSEDGVGAGTGSGSAGGVTPVSGDEARRLGDTPAASAVVALLRGLRG